MNEKQDQIEAGTITQVDPKKSLAKVNVLGMQTQWLPVLQQANSIKKQRVALEVGQQVVVLANRYIIGSIFNQSCLEPNDSSNTVDITEYQDGTKIKYDTTSKKLTIDCKGEVEINVAGDAKVTSSKEVKVTGTNISLNGGKGVVTGDHICAFTGSPHSHCSQKVTAGS